MKLLTPKDVAEITGLPYSKALLLIKSANHVQINNRYYITEKVLHDLLNHDGAILIKEEI